MAVMENARENTMISSNQPDPNADVAVDHHHLNQQSTKAAVNQKSTKLNDQNYNLMQRKITSPQSNGHHMRQQSINGNRVSEVYPNSEGEESVNGGDDDGQEGFKREMRDLEEMLSKLNPMAKEFVPPSLTVKSNGGRHRRLVPPPHAAGAVGGIFGYNTNGFLMQQHLNSGVPIGHSIRRKKYGYSHGEPRMNGRTSLAQREDVIRRTVYVSDIDHQVTEEQLAAIFVSCGQVVDCRVCGDPNSVLRFAFIEFTDEEGAQNALSLGGIMLGYYPLKVLPSKTAIAPVNPTFLPRSEDEREMCARTIYCANIDKKVTQADVKLFFESICGEVNRLRLLGDYNHSTRIAFVEFVMAESAIAALNCSGAVLGSLPIRVSPSKTPVRPRAPRQSMH
ncbi:polyadenylate-binding -interacting 11-like [Olea europaea subsp. europaea]|uniref:Polyadenylate-binding -interacting 11-like n=1 Tax=Olea europaea subsp. europaea TaxID=158383 RepID=A0A8S0TZ70_OLEEU|nr:polyadenylate-binding -interacting 11-like [Olea europaea subsp. europaea]